MNSPSPDETKAESPKPASHFAERRSTDAMPQKFEAAALKGAAHAHAAFADAEIETIDMDAALPPGHHPELDDHHGPQTVAPAAPAYTPGQNRARLALVKFKQSIDEFAVADVTLVHIGNVKRGDVIEIETIVGSLYFRVVDRIKGLSKGVGELLCECRYDLQDQWEVTHPASITVPLCSKAHLIVNPDGTQRPASRALKMRTEAELPEAITKLLRESFFVSIKIHATPVPDKLRVIDALRFCMRVVHRIMRWVEENNRHEREKEERKREAKRQKEEEKQRKREEKKAKAGG